MNILLRKVNQSDLDDAPDLSYITAQNDAINKLVDATSTIAQPQSIKLLAQGDVELIEIDVQVPDPWATVGVGSAPAFQNSYSGTVQYMKDYNGVVHVSFFNVSGGAGSAVFTLPAPSFCPAQNANNVVWDGFTGSATAIMTITSAGVVNVNGIGAHTFSHYISFMSKDTTPTPLSCFPVTSKTSLKSVAGVAVVGVSDSGGASSQQQARAGTAGAVDFTTVNGSKGLQIKINNIMGLPYNRKIHLKLLAIGGS